MALPNFFASNTNDPYAPPVDRKRVFVAFGVGAAVVVSLILFAFTLFSGDAKGTYMTMLARHQALVATIDESQKKIRDGKLAKANSDALLLLTSDSVALQEQLKKKFGADKVNDDAKKRGTDANVAKKLQEASLLDKFDITYRNIVREQLNKLTLEALEVADETGGKEFTPVLDKYIEDLKTIDTQLGELTIL